MALAISQIGGVNAYSSSSNASTGNENFTLSSVSNGCIFVTFSIYDTTLANRTMSSVTWNGVALTKKRATEITGAGGQRVELWYLINPASGAHTLSWATGGGSPFVDLGVTFFSGVDQTTPIEADNESTHSGVTSESVSLTTLTDNAYIIDVCECASGPQSPGASQTRNWDQSGSTSSGSTRGSLTPTGSYSTSYTTAGSDNFVMIGAVIKPQGVVATTTVVSKRLLMGVGI